MTVMSFEPLIPVLLTREELEMIERVIKLSRDYLYITNHGHDVLESTVQEIRKALS